MALGIVSAGLVASPRPAFACKIGLAAELPITRLDDGRVVIMVGINHRPVPMLLDTASTGSLLFADAAGRAHVAAQTFTGSRLANDTAESVSAHKIRWNVIDLLELGGQELTQFQMLVRERGDNPKSDAGQDGAAHRFDGQLALDALSVFDLDLDLQSGQLRLFVTEPLRLDHPCTVLRDDVYTAPLLALGYGAEERFANPMNPVLNYVPVKIGNVTLNAVIDTASAVSTITQAAAERAGLHDGADGRTQPADAVSIGEITLAHLRFAHSSGPGGLRVHVNYQGVLGDGAGGENPDVRIGMDIIGKTHLWISRSSRNALFQVPPQPTPEVPPR